MLRQRLATGATGVKQARYRRRPTRGSEALVGACAVYTQRCVCMCVGAVECETCIIPPRVLHFSAILYTVCTGLPLFFHIYTITYVQYLPSLGVWGNNKRSWCFIHFCQRLACCSVLNLLHLHASIGEPLFLSHTFPLLTVWLPALCTMQLSS